MATRKGLITLGRIEPSPEQPKPVAKIEKKAETRDQKSLEISYLQKQITAYEDYRQMMTAEKNTEEYNKLRETWLKKREEIEEYDQRMEEKLPAADWEEYQTSYNLSEARAKKRLQELGGSQNEKIIGLSRRIEITSNTRVEGGTDEESSEDIWKPLAGKDNPEKMTLEQKKKRLEMVRGAAGPLTVAYWENAVANHQEQEVREEAEDHRDEVEETEAEEGQLREQLRAEKKRIIGVLEEPNDPEIGRLEKRLEEVQEELERVKKEASLGQKFKKGVEDSVKKIKKEKKKEEKEAENAEVFKLAKESQRKTFSEELNGFFRERLKGFSRGFGWWEVHQAEKFRLGTKKVGKDIKAQSELLEKNKGYLLEEDTKEYMSILDLGDRLTDEKREFNKAVKDKIIANASQKLEVELKKKSWFEEYKSLFGDSVISQERMENLQKKIREKLNALEEGLVSENKVNFKKLIRHSLDKPWWQRYIWSIIEPMYAGKLIGALGGKVIFSTFNFKGKS